MTGIYTGRSPKDKFFGKRTLQSAKTLYGGLLKEYKNDNKPVTTETWNVLRKNWLLRNCQTKKLYVVDGFCRRLANTYLKVRFIAGSCIAGGVSLRQAFCVHPSV